MTDLTALMTDHRAHTTGCITWLTSFASINDSEFETLRQAAGYDHCNVYLLAYDMGKMQTALLLARKSRTRNREARLAAEAKVEQVLAYADQIDQSESLYGWGVFDRIQEAAGDQAVLPCPDCQPTPPYEHTQDCMRFGS